jgi:hypothetical protein
MPELFNQLETLGALDQYGGDALHLLQQACTPEAGDSSSEQLEPFVRAWLSLVDRNWWDGLHNNRASQFWDGQENHLPQRVGELLSQHTHEYGIATSFRPALALNILRDLRNSAMYGNQHYRAFVRKMLEGGKEEFLPAATLPLIIRMNGTFRDTRNADSDSILSWIQRLLIQRFLSERPHEFDLIFSPTGKSTWENITIGQIKPINSEQQLYKAWEKHWSTIEQDIPKPTGDFIDQRLASQIDEILAQSGSEAVDLIPDKRRRWLLARFEAILTTNDDRRSYDGPEGRSTLMLGDTPALRAIVDRAKLMQVTEMADKTTIPQERRGSTRHKM